jgi:hypothetical protein
MDCILTVRSEVKIKFGARESAAAHVAGLWQAMDKEGEGCADLGQKFPKISEANLEDNIRWSTTSTTIRIPRLKDNIKCCSTNSMAGIWKHLQRLS